MSLAPGLFLAVAVSSLPDLRSSSATPPTPEMRREAVKPCPADKPLGGHVDVRWSHASVDEYSRDTRTRMWFRLKDPHSNQQWPWAVASHYQAGDVVWKTEALPCVDIPDKWGNQCSCSGGRAAGRTLFGHDGRITFYAMAPSLSVSIPDVIRESIKSDLKCVSRNSGSTGHGTEVVGGGHDVIPGGPTDSSYRTVAGKCFNAQGPQLQQCGTRPDLYAVIPFYGAGKIDTKDSRDTNTERMRWEVCCGCGEPPRDTPEGEKGCANADSQRGQLELQVDKSAALRAELKKRLDHLLAEWDQARMRSSDYELLNRSCGEWDAAMTLMKFLIAGPSATEGARSFVIVFNILDKVSKGDPGVALIGLGGINWGENFGPFFQGASATRAWEMVKNVSRGVNAVSGSRSLSDLKERVDKCAGTPMVSFDTVKAAREFLVHFEASMKEMSEIEALTTRITQADDALLTAWRTYHAACLESARCRGADPAICSPAPPPLH